MCTRRLFFYTVMTVITTAQRIRVAEMESKQRANLLD